MTDKDRSQKLTFEHFNWCSGENGFIKRIRKEQNNSLKTEFGKNKIKRLLKHDNTYQINDRISFNCHSTQYFNIVSLL